MIAHEVLQIPEVAAYKCESLVVDDVTLCISVLIETVEVGVARQAFQNFATVTTAAKRDVDIDFVLSDVKPVNTLFEQYGHMVGQVLVFHP